ncbi:nuclear transport factor 2 family protein [Phaeobacter sp.]|uniref:nuclear transport factor 2 family protein n=1 Tax=Phaeobacter sp. TaxID=1902409 RepID=UPI0025CCF45B|nr:nuclear transport factor 2 family protein [Phaeobacter sp.]
MTDTSAGTSSDQLLSDILACETAVWQALVDGDAAADEAALHPDFLGVYPSGFATRRDHVAQLHTGPTVATFTIEEPRLLMLSTDCVLLAYRATFTRVAKPDAAFASKTQDGTSSDTSDVLTGAMYVRSLWQRHDRRWLNMFSQDSDALPEGAENHLP